MTHFKTPAWVDPLGSFIRLGDYNVVRRFDLAPQDFSSTPFSSSVIGTHNICGGPLATFFDDPFGKGGDVVLYSNTGSYLRTIKVSKQSPVKYLSWNNKKDHLLVVLADGTVQFWNYAGEEVAPALNVDADCTHFSLTGSGLAAFLPEGTTGGFVVLVEPVGNGYQSRKVSIPKLSEGLSISSVCTLPVPAHAASGAVEVIVVYPTLPNQCSVGRCSFGSSAMFHNLGAVIDERAIRHMALCPRGERVAFLTEGGAVCVTTCDFQELLYIGTITTGTASSLIWCGSHCVVVCARGASAAAGSSCDTPTQRPAELVLLNADRPCASRRIGSLPQDLIISQDLDGVRVMGNGVNFFLQVVSEKALRLFTPSTGSASSKLMMCFDEYTAGNAAAVGFINEFQENPLELNRAIEDCVAAAAGEVDPSIQKRIMRVAAFGKAFNPGSDPLMFTETAAILRVCNTLLRVLSLHISTAQLRFIGKSRLINRLVGCGEYQVAFSVASFFGLKTDSILLEWAVDKLVSTFTQATTEEQNVKQCIALLKKLHFAQFSELGLEVNAKGRRAAAVSFIKEETNAQHCVSAFLEIGEANLALEKAVEFHEADLIFLSITHLLQRYGASAPGLFSEKREAMDAYVNYIRSSFSETSKSRLGSVLLQNQLRIYLGEFLKDDQNQRDSDYCSESLEILQQEKTLVIKEAAACCRKAEEADPHFASPKNGTHLIGQQALQEEQKNLASELRDPRFLSASIISMVALCAEHKNESAALRLKEKFAIPERKFQYCLLRAYCSSGQWELVDKLGARKTKLLVPAEVFIEELLRYSRDKQAQPYIVRVAELESRLEYYIQCGDWFTAAADCQRSGKPGLLAELKKRAKGNTEALSLVEQGTNSKTGNFGLSIATFFSP